VATREVMARSGIERQRTAVRTTYLWAIHAGFLHLWGVQSTGPSALPAKSIHTKLWNVWPRIVTRYVIGLWRVFGAVSSQLCAK